ncbi:NACHT domain-containing protein [Sarocladium implicatum]|nr:NACHT domain-containing protein [Sarocladium implicatum]
MSVDVAIGIASLVIELCDLSAKLYNKYTEQQDQLQRLTDVELERELAELKTCVARLETAPELPIGIERCFHRNDYVSSNLLSALEELRPEPGQSRAESLRKAWKSLLKAKKLEQLKDEVESRRERTNSLLISLSVEYHKLSLERQSELLNNQEKQYELSQQIKDDILGVLAVQRRDMQTLVFDMKSGGTKTFETGSGIQVTGNNEQDMAMSVTSFRTASGTQPAGATKADFHRIFEHVRTCLHFDRLSERQSVIKEAHFATFRWIYEETGPDFETQAFSSFPTWLQKGDGCYWIQGKAGSGKSTLVKQIQGHKTTRHFLDLWGGGSRVHVVSFFFWYMGSSLQKTKEGMLRSLLFSLLDKAPELVLKVFPDLFIEASKLTGGTILPPPSLGQLLQAFKLLVEACQESRDMKICFFIDGLDECSESKPELAEFLVDLGAQTKAIKFVLSSRPLSEFMDIFDHLPGLRVQDLTKTDILRYTKSFISPDRYAMDPIEVETLISTISDKSQGVFLWVAVVVQKVLEGLRHGDTLEELQLRVKKLPSELKDLYKRMLEDIDASYRSQAAEMLLLVATVFDPMHPKQDDPLIDPFPAIQLSFALDGCGAAVHAPVRPIADEEVQGRIDRLEPRLRSRCLGLLEYRDRRSKYKKSGQVLPGSRLFSMAVEPFHRTAVEFLLDEEVSTFLRDQTSPDFDAYNSLYCSTVQMAKIVSSFFPGCSEHEQIDIEPWRHLPEILCLSSEAARRGRGIDTTYLNEMDRVLRKQWSTWAQKEAPTQFQDSPWISTLLCNRDNHQGDWIKDSELDFRVALDNKLCSQLLGRCQELGYLRIASLVYRPDDLKLLMGTGPTLSRDGLTLLLALLLQTRYNPRDAGTLELYFQSDAESALLMLLAAGADPNAPDSEDSSITLWMRFLVCMHDFLLSKSAYYIPADGGVAFEVIIKGFIEHGADLSVTLRWQDELFPPSAYVYTLYLFATEGLKDDESSVALVMFRNKFEVLQKSLERTAMLLRDHEQKQGVYSRSRRTMKWLGLGRRSSAKPVKAPPEQREKPASSSNILRRLAFK